MDASVDSSLLSRLYREAGWDRICPAGLSSRAVRRPSNEGLKDSTSDVEHDSCQQAWSA